MAEKIIQNNLLDQYVSDMQRYSIYVTRKRVTPSILDGLKPVQRRIVYSMYAFNHATSQATKKKSAICQGSTMALHPHGDDGIYGSFPTMVNWFESKLPLITGYGNFGTFSGDKAAAARYTEVSLSPFCMECIMDDLISDKNSVDWEAAYTGILEPEYLPVKIPLLLVNGSFSIGVGLKVDIPTHNLGEVIDQTIALINNPNHRVVLAPDHCMPCIIENTDFESVSNTGYGNYRIRGIIDIEEFHGDTALVIKSTPNLTFLDTITEKIEELVEKNKIIQIKAVYEKSTIDHMRYIIVLKKGADPNYVREVIYKNTEMEKSDRINFEVLDDITPKRISYTDYIRNFIEFRKNTKFRLYCNQLQKIQTKFHEIEAYVKLLESGEIDNVISMIKNQTNIDDAYLTEYLIKKIKVTDLQAKYILNSDLKKLAKGHLAKYKADMVDLVNKQKGFMDRIIDDKIITQEIIDELVSIKAKYNTPRLCKIVNKFNHVDVPVGVFKVILTENNYIKKVPENDSITTARGDRPKQIVVVDNTENILLFDEVGKVYKLPVDKITFADRNSSGADLRLLIKGLTTKINTIIYEPLLKDLANGKHKYYLTVLSNNGYIKRMDLTDFMAVNPSGLLYSKLDQGDFVNSVLIIGNKTDIIVYSDRKAVRMNCDMIPYLKRNTKGNRVMSSATSIDGMSVISNDTTDVIVVTASGRINKFSILGMPYPKTKSGTSVVKLGKTDRIIGLYGVNSSTDVLRIRLKSGFVNIPVNTIPDGSSIGGGQKMISTTANDPIIRCDVFKNNI